MITFEIFLFRSLLPSIQQRYVSPLRTVAGDKIQKKIRRKGPGKREIMSTSLWPHTIALRYNAVPVTLPSRLGSGGGGYSARRQSGQPSIHLMGRKECSRPLLTNYTITLVSERSARCHRPDAMRRKNIRCAADGWPACCL